MKITPSRHILLWDRNRDDEVVPFGIMPDDFLLDFLNPFDGHFLADAALFDLVFQIIGIFWAGRHYRR